MGKFKEENSLDARKAECDKIRKHWPDKIPVVAEKITGSKLSEIPKSKLICPQNYKVYQFLAYLRSKLSLDRKESLFIFFNNTLIQGDRLMGDLYQQHKEEDGFLYMVYSEHEYLG